MTDETINLPPLPRLVGYRDRETGGLFHGTTNPELMDALYTQDQMEAYTRAAVLADRARPGDMYWNPEDPESGGGDLQSVAEDMTDAYNAEDFPVEVTLQQARRLPDVRVRVSLDVNNVLDFEVLGAKS